MHNLEDELTPVVPQISAASVRRLVLSVASALAVVLALIAVMGVNPFAALASLFHGAVGTPFTIGQTIVIGAVLTMTGLAAAIPFTARMFNVGGEGQMFAGASAALTAGVLMGDVPGAMWFALFAGAIGGALWGLVPAVIRAFLGGSEMIVSLLTNFVAVYVTDLVIREIFPNTNGQATVPVADAARLPRIWSQGGVHIGVIVALVLAVAVWIILSHTRWGFAIRATGFNPRTAELAGFSEKLTTMLIFSLAGAAAGVGGAFLVLGGSGELSHGLSPGYGFIGVMVALFAGLRPLWVPVAAVLTAGLLVGSNRLQIDVGLPVSMGVVVLSVIVLALLATRVIVLKRGDA